MYQRTDIFKTAKLKRKETKTTISTGGRNKAVLPHKTEVEGGQGTLLAQEMMLNEKGTLLP
jgi:hypothetical protein